MPVREEINYIAVDDEMPENDKIEPLSDAGFRLLVETWCYCSRQLNDGIMTASAWHKRGTAKTRRELEDADLVERLPDGQYEVHDYRAGPRGRSPLPRHVRTAVIERDGMVCGICRNAVTDVAAIHIDHIKPVSIGGSDDIGNLRVAHAYCNLSRGARA